MAGKPQPQRRCVGCSERFDKRDLMRIVRTPQGDVRLDPTGRMNGRGAYVCRRTECLELAIKRGSLERALEAPLPAGIVTMMRDVLALG